MAFEILLSMVARNIHHLPVTDPTGTVIGMVSSTDLMRLERANPVYIASDIQKMTTVEELSAVGPRLAQIVTQLVREDATADDIGRIFPAIGDALQRRRIELGMARLGHAPGPFCWVSLGSAARLEQGLSSDQDNGIILSDEVLADRPQPLRRIVVHWPTSFDRPDRLRIPTVCRRVMATNLAGGRVWPVTEMFRE